MAVVAGPGYSIADAPNNEVVINFTSPLISLFSDSQYVVRGEPVGFTLTADSPVLTDTDVRLMTYDNRTGIPIRSFSVTISAGRSIKKFDIDPVEYGNSSDVAVAISSNPDYQIRYYSNEHKMATNFQVVEIADIGRPKISVTPLQEKIREGEDDAIFIISATPPPSEDLTIYLELIIDAERGIRENLIIPAGTSSVEFLVPIVDDLISDDDYLVNLYIIINPNYDFFYPERITRITVYDNDPPFIEVKYENHDIVEGEDAVFIVSASSVVAESLPINVRISETGNFVKENYIEELTISADTDSAYLRVPTEDDDLFERTGKVFAEILPGSGYLVAEITRKNWINVEDNDDSASLEFTAVSDSVVEGESAIFELYARASSSVDRQINLQVNSLGGDFLGREFPNFVVIPSGVRYVKFSIPTEDDDVFEVDGAMEVTIEPGVGYLVDQDFSQLNVVIRDNDAPVGLAIVPTVNSILEGETAQFQVYSFSDQESDLTVAVELTQIGDFLVDEVGIQSVFIPAGTNVGQLNVSTLNDETDEVGGYIVARLMSDQGENNISSYSRAVISVADDDLPTISISRSAESVLEGTEIRYILTADQLPVHNVFVNVGIEQEGNFVNGFAASTTAMIALGETETEIVLQTRDDEVDELDGLVTATILAGAGYQLASDTDSALSVDVVDNDDPPVLSIYADLDQVTEGNKSLFTITASRVSAIDKEIDYRDS